MFILVAVGNPQLLALNDSPTMSSPLLVVVQLDNVYVKPSENRCNIVGQQLPTSLDVTC